MASEQVVKAAAGTGAAGEAAAGGVAAPAQAADGVLANRDFVKLWAGETVSLIGTQVTQFTMPLVAILTLNATVLQVGVLNALRFLPLIPLSLLAGVLLDRGRRRPVLVVCALGNAAVIGLVPLASLTGLLSIGLLYAVTVLAGTLSMTFEVGVLSYVPFLVAPRHLPAANSRLWASTAVAGISGPGLAGLLVGLLTAPITLSVDAVSYVFSAVSLIWIGKVEPAPDPSAGRSPIRRSIAEGLHAVYGSRLLRTLLTQSAAYNLFYGAMLPVFLVYAVRVLGLSPAKLGIVVGAAAVGGLFGALLATRTVAALGLGRAMALCTVGLSAGPLLFVIPRGAGPVSIVILVLAQLIYGFDASMFNVNAITLRQTVTPPRLLARMNATYRMVIYGVPLLGATGGGLLGTAVGLRPALVILLAAMTSPVLWMFFAPVFRLSRMPAGPLPPQRKDETDE